ncbi:YdcF family protein [Pararhodobacter zhoushanensis]|uniref:YdcF family protein n=1 Tax=Pararhodobacter zhoushanensis TaxID=2479545 RepID=UPI000F8DDCCD|nr:YdcF family protein [Pararhodobacter zhoushanensis]
MTAHPTVSRVAVVLGAAVWAGSEPSPTLRRRVDCAVGLYHDGRVAAILGCGGVGRHRPSEAAVMARLCLEAGVPETAVLLEDQSTSTRENLVNAQQILRALGISDVVVVSDPYHLPRARLIARQLGMRITTAAPPWHQIGPRQRLRHIPREALALCATLLRLR